MAFEDVFDNDLDTDHTFSGPVAGNWIAWRLSTVAAITGWRVAQMDPEVNSATSIAFFATNDPDAYALVCSDGPTGDPPGDWTAIETVDVEAETDLTGLFAGGPHAYEYWFAEAIAGGDEAWHLHELAVTGASSDDFCGVGCDHKHHAEDVILADGTTVEDALAMAAAPDHTHPEYIAAFGGGPEDVHFEPSAGAALELDLVNGNWQHLILDDATCALTIVGWAPAPRGSSASLFIQMTAGSEEIDWSGLPMVWTGGVEPVLPTGAGDILEIAVKSYDEGATIIGTAIGGPGGGGSIDFGEVGDISASAFGDTAAAGVTAEVADAGHRHAREANPVTAHEAASDPHTGYVREASADWVDLTDGGASTLHSHGAGSHTEDHDHDGSPTQKIAQANSHESPDTDAGTGSLHHTIGAGANQSAAGNHSHGAAAFSGVSLTKSATQAVTTSTSTAVTFDGEDFDTDTYHDNASNTSRITVPATGFYLFGGSIEMTGMADNTFSILRLRLNGTTVLHGRSRIDYATGSGGANTYSKVLSLTAGDYIELMCEHNDAAADVRESVNGTSFWAYRVG